MTAPRTKLQVVLRGTGSCVPSRVFSNTEFPASLDTSDEWILTRTGIRERRVAGEQEFTSTLAIESARAAVDAAGILPSDLDLIVCATVTPDVIVPTVATRVQKALGCRMIPAFDLNAACSGFLYALTVTEQFIRNGTARKALVIGSDTLTRVVDFSERSSCILFGDGAGAAVLAATTEPDCGILFSRLYSDGSDMILLTGHGSRPAAKILTPPPDEFPAEYIHINGREVFKFAVHRIRELTEEVLTTCSLRPEQIDLVIPHQVNQRILDTAFAGLGIPPDRIMTNLARYGNTSAASVPIALDEAVRTGRVRPGNLILLLAFGGGLTWSGMLLSI